MSARTLSGAAAIAGIGQTEFSKESGRSELQLSVEAVQHALAGRQDHPQALHVGELAGEVLADARAIREEHIAALDHVHVRHAQVWDLPTM